MQLFVPISTIRPHILIVLLSVPDATFHNAGNGDIN